jgi:hypothetical protein
MFMSSYRVKVFFSEFNKTSIFSSNFRKKFHYNILRKSVQWEPTDGQTDRRTDGQTYRNFANVSKYRFLGDELLSNMYTEQTGLALTLQTFLSQYSEWVNLSRMRSFAVYYSASRKTAEYYLH